jgi:hypothetical protein
MSPLLAAIAWLLASSPALAQGAAPVTEAACAPHATADAPPAGALRVIGAQDTVVRTIFGPRDLLVVDGGTAQGVEAGQRFFVRRHTVSRGDAMYGKHAVSTAGWLRIVAASDRTAIAAVEAACRAIEAGDYLEAYTDVPLPPGDGQASPLGELDFASPARILFGDEGRTIVAAGDFAIADGGAEAGFAAGSRFAVYRDLRLPGIPLAFVGEGRVVAPASGTSLVRITLARDAVQSGDLLIPARP